MDLAAPAPLRTGTPPAAAPGTAPLDTDLVRREFAPQTLHLNTASYGLLPARTVAAVREGAEAQAAGLLSLPGLDPVVADARAAYARLVGTEPDRVALGAVVSTLVAAVAAGLPRGAEVVLPDCEFASVTQPFAARGDLVPRLVPLERLADAVGPRTALVAFSAVQSADGRIADLAAVRAAAREHGARTLLDVTQAAGWFPVAADEWDYTVCGAYKWLMCPRGTAFLTVRPEAAGDVVPVNAGWTATGSPWTDCYGLAPLAEDARRFDTSPVWTAFVGAGPSLRLVEELGVAAVHRHDVALAERFRAGLRELGYEAPGAGSAIVSVPGLGDRAPLLERAGVRASSRAGHLRFAFHLYTTEADVDRVLDALAGCR
ncbi:aminotransferase class V-fold PLP-dependent enzyme [Streptomyces capparidis]